MQPNRLITATFISTLFLNACGASKKSDNAAPNTLGKTENSVKSSGLFGLWGTLTAQLKDEGGFQIGKVETTFTFSDAKTLTQAYCTFNDGRRVGPAANDIATNFTATNIEFIEARSAVFDDGHGSKCTLSNVVGAFDYVLNQNNLRIDPANGVDPAINLQRIK